MVSQENLAIIHNNSAYKQKLYHNNCKQWIGEVFEISSIFPSRGGSSLQLARSTSVARRVQLDTFPEMSPLSWRFTYLTLYILLWALAFLCSGRALLHIKNLISFCTKFSNLTTCHVQIPFWNCLFPRIVLR